MSVRAGALSRLARVSRKRGDVDLALKAYDQLAGLDQTLVDGLPASLVARLGRASAFEEAGRAAELETEARALCVDLERGRWQLLEAEYESYLAHATAWQRTKPDSVEPEALARSRAATWLWDNRASLDSAGIDPVSKICVQR